MPSTVMRTALITPYVNEAGEPDPEIQGGICGLGKTLPLSIFFRPARCVFSARVVVEVRHRSGEDIAGPRYLKGSILRGSFEACKETLFGLLGN